ncbi:MAG: flagellar export chaperone FliS [Aquificaceae bacterium]
MINAYLENMVFTANPVRQVILLYDKAISCLEEAVEIMEKGSQDYEDIKAKYQALGRATEILTVLKLTLNKEEGGEVAKNLEDIYEALSKDLIRITIEGDEPETIKKMVKILKDLRESWEEVERSVYGKPKTDTYAV